MGAGETLQELFTRAFRQRSRETPDASSSPKGGRLQALGIAWEGRRVIAGYGFSVPTHGVVTAEILSCSGATEQGFDLKVKGGLKLSDGSSVKTLRTWHDPKLESSVTYEYRAGDGVLATWNVYRVVWAGRTFDEMWTGNAGMLVEQETARSALFRCSAGPCPRPDFDSIVYRVTIHD